MKGPIFNHRAKLSKVIARASKMTSLEACAQLCKVTSGCGAISFVESKQLCLVSSTNDPAATRFDGGSIHFVVDAEDACLTTTTTTASTTTTTTTGTTGDAECGELYAQLCAMGLMTDTNFEPCDSEFVGETFREKCPPLCGTCSA